MRAVDNPSQYIKDSLSRSNSRLRTILKQHKSKSNLREASPNPEKTLKRSASYFSASSCTMLPEPAREKHILAQSLNLSKAEIQPQFIMNSPHDSVQHILH